MRWNPFRITELWAKLVYVLLWVVGAMVAVLTLRPPGIWASLLQILIQTAAVFVAVRSFRGAGEPAIPERPWWRATARPTAGFVIAVILGLNAAQYLLKAVLQAIAVATAGGEIGFPWGLVESALFVAWSGGVAAFYLNSSFRLRRAPAPTKWVSRDSSPTY